jgi:hypothetical protein
MGDHGPPGARRAGGLSIEVMFPAVPDDRCTPRGKPGGEEGSAGAGSLR